MGTEDQHVSLETRAEMYGGCTTMEQSSINRVRLNMCWPVLGQVAAYARHCYISNTDVGVGWSKGLTRSGPIICHTEEAFVGTRATL